MKLSLRQKIILGLFGKVKVGYREKPTWSAPIMHYAFRCPKHGVQVDYLHGWRKYLTCPVCLEERR